MTLDEIKTAVRAGKRVYWKSAAYEVRVFLTRSGAEQWLIVCGQNCTGLTHRDGVTMSEKTEDFYTA